MNLNFDEAIGIPIPTPKSFAADGSGDRNKAAQEDALRKYLANSQKVLEVASGFGEAISYFANSHPDTVFVPTDVQKPCLDRLQELSETHDNLLPPVELNIFRASQWGKVAKQGPFDGILVFNLIHLIPWSGTSELLDRACDLLAAQQGFLAIHGAFLREGMFMSESDREFDADIRSRDPEWGLRDLEQVVRMAGDRGFRKEEIREMRAGNWMLILRRHN